LDGTLEHEEWFEGSRRIVYKESVAGVGEFPFFSIYSFSCIAKQVMTLKQLRFLSCLDFLETNLERLVMSSDITFELPISPALDHARDRRAPMTFQHGLMRRLNITTSIMFQILKCNPDHTILFMEPTDFLLTYREDE
jgi:hypothetical protein